MMSAVSNRQLVTILFLTLTGYSVIELPKIMAESVGNGAWFTLMITSVIFAFTSLILTYLGTVFEEKTLFEYSTILVGKSLAKIISVIYLFYFFGVLILITKSVALVINHDYLEKTPMNLIVFMCIVPSIYAASKGLTNIARIIELYGVIILLTAFFLHSLMIYKGDVLNIRPFFNPDEVVTYLKGISSAIIPFLGIEVITFIPISKNNGKKIIMICFFTIVFVGFFYSFIVETVFMMLSIEDTIHYNDALIIAIRQLEIPLFQFFTRLDSVFYIVWIMAVFSTISILLYGVNDYATKLLPKINMKVSLMGIGLLNFIGCILINGPDEITSIFKYFSYIGLFVLIGIPLFLLLVYKGRKNVEKSS